MAAHLHVPIYIRPHDCTFTDAYGYARVYINQLFWGEYKQAHEPVCLQICKLVRSIVYISTDECLSLCVYARLYFCVSCKPIVSSVLSCKLMFCADFSALRLQGLMSLPDLLLKDSLFRLAPTGPSSQRESGKNKLLGPLNNPLLESNEDNSETQGGEEEEGEAAAPPVAMAASDAPPATSDVPDTLSASPPSKKGEASADTAEELPDEKPQQNEKRLVIPEALRERLESLYNASQLAALEDSLKVEGVTLIQGPPGTGKTSTIVGVVSVILHAQLEGQQDHKSGLISVSCRPSMTCMNCVVGKLFFL